MFKIKYFVLFLCFCFMLSAGMFIASKADALTPIGGSCVGHSLCESGLCDFDIYECIENPNQEPGPEPELDECPGNNPPCQTQTRDPITLKCNNPQIHANDPCTTSEDEPGTCKLSSDGSVACVAIPPTVCSSTLCRKGGYSDTGYTACGDETRTCGSAGFKAGTVPADNCDVGESCVCCVNHPEDPEAAPRCGDGEINQEHEQCDDGNVTSGDGCSSACEIEECGDDIKNIGEECDDGNTISGDGCSDVCARELMGQCSDCGVGVLNLCDPEECSGLGTCVSRRSRGLWYCEEGTVVNIIVKDALRNEPQANVRVSMGGGGCTTNENGTCTTILPPGVHNAFIYDERFMLTWVSPKISVFRKNFINIPQEGPVDVEINPYLASCDDSDPTDDYYVRGEIWAFKETKTDYCRNNLLYQYQCLTELDGYECMAGCAEGVCIKPTDENAKAKVTFNLENEKGQAAVGVNVAVSSGVARCLTGYNGSCTVELYNPGNYTASVRHTFYSCLGELGCPKSFTALAGDNKISLTLRDIPLKMETCSDTDRGLDYYSKGAARDNKSGGAGRIVLDRCTGREYSLEQRKFIYTTVIEAFCMENDFAWDQKYTCPNECVDGVCISEEPESIACTDTDSNSLYSDGINFGYKGTATDATGDYTDYCQNDYIEEYYCEDDEQVGRTAKKCLDGCYDGVCLDDDDSDAKPDDPATEPPAPIEDSALCTDCHNDCADDYDDEKDDCKKVEDRCQDDCRDDYEDGYDRCKSSDAINVCMNPVTQEFNDCNQDCGDDYDDCKDPLRDKKNDCKQDCDLGICSTDPEGSDTPPTDEDTPSEDDTSQGDGGTGVTYCEDCGGSLTDLNVCDYNECMRLGDCTYDAGRVLNKCNERRNDQVTPKGGGTYQKTPSGTPNRVTIYVPSGAIPSKYSFGEISIRAYHIEDGDAPRWVSTLPAGTEVISGYVYSFEILSNNDEEIRNFNEPVTVSIRYNPSALEGRDQENLFFHLYSTSANRWETFPIILDGSTISFQTDHFSEGYLSGSIATIIVTPPAGSLISGGLKGLVARLLGWIFFVVVVLAPLMIIIGAYMYITSRGRVERTQQAKRLILWAVLGLVVAASGKIIISVINDILGI